MWTEKYRPSKISDLSLNDNTLDKINNIIRSKDMPNIIITGTPGVGKTTTILCMSNALLGEYMRDGVLELNASDNRGVKAIQETSKFCKKKFVIPDKYKDKYTYHKIILYDEADNITPKAQRMINNLMEKYKQTTRFAFTCNNSTDIIESIQSRCMIFRYPKLTNDMVTEKLKIICELENVTYTLSGISSLALISQGDMRQAINNLQMVNNTYGIVNDEILNTIFDRPNSETIKNIFINCKNNDLCNAIRNVQLLINNGYSSSDIMLSMVSFIKTYNVKELDDHLKNKYFEKISKSLFILSKGIETQIQLTSLICKLIKND